MKSLLAEFATSLKAVSVRAIGVFSTLLISVYLVRQYGVEVNGAFQLSFAFAMIASAIAKLGQDQLALRENAKYCARNEPEKATALLKSSLILVIPFSSFVAFVLIILINLFNRSLTTYIAAFFPFIIAISVIWIAAEGMRGWQHINISIFWQAAFIPLAFLLSIFFLNIPFSIDPLFLPLIYSIISMISVLAICYYWRLITPGGFSGRNAELFSYSILIEKGKHFWVLAILTSLAGWIDLVVLSFVASNEIIGLYQPIVRTGTVIAVLINMATAALVPRLALLFMKNDQAEFIKVTRLYWIAIILGSTALCLVLSLNVDYLLSVWGPEFRIYRNEFVIYIAVQLIQSFFILPMLVSPVIGLEKELSFIQIIVLPIKIASIALGFIFLEILGVIYALGLCTCISSLFIFYVYIRHLKRKGMPWQQLVLGRL